MSIFAVFSLYLVLKLIKRRIIFDMVLLTKKSSFSTLLIITWHFIFYTQNISPFLAKMIISVMSIFYWDHLNWVNNLITILVSINKICFLCMHYKDLKLIHLVLNLPVCWHTGLLKKYVLDEIKYMVFHKG